jgi:hypothetical protein
MILRVLFFAKLFLLIVGVYSQTSFFEKKYGDMLPDNSRAVLQDSDANIYMLGTTVFTNNAQVALTKTDWNGNYIWTKYYGGSFNDFGISMIIYNNELIITYEKESVSGNIDIGLIKVDTSGAVIWQNDVSSSLNESPRQIIKSLDNQFLICGFISDDFSSNDIYVVKTDSLGNIIWDIAIGGSDNDYASGIIQLPDSTIIVSGDTRSFSTGGYDVYLIKLDKNGNILWDQAYGNQYDNGSQGIIFTQNQKVFIFGETHTGIGLDFDYYTLLVDTSGAQLWQYDLGWEGTDAAFSAIESSDGNFILTGYSNSNDTLNPLNLSVFKINHSGNILWQQFYGGAGVDIGFNIIHSQGGGVLVTGQTYDENFDTQQYLLHLTYTGVLNSIESDAIEAQRNNGAVFPNPFSESFFIQKTTSDADVVYEMFSIKGEEIPIIVQNNKIIPSINLPPSLYFLRETSAAGVNFYKIIKK